MLISISGAQSSGKSTILNKIKELGYDVVERKTSRSILQEWGVTLETVNMDPEWTLKFQQEIIERKYNDELAFASSKKVVFTERTYADLMGYFLMALGRANTYSEQINDYYIKSIRYQQSYSKVFYLKSGHFVPEQDGVRGSNVHYSRMSDLVISDFTRQMTPSNKLTIIDTPCLDQRLEMIVAHCGLYNVRT